MSFEAFTKENLDFYLNELAKEYRKINRKKTPAEIILIGGASVLANYGFRDMTTDIDAIIQAGWDMKDAIEQVAYRLALPPDWLNADFKKSASYSPKLLQYSSFYKQFAHILDVRTVKDEYLVAMKLKSFQKYKHDVSDIAGIVYAMKCGGTELTMDSLNNAVADLYGGWDAFPEGAHDFAIALLKDGALEQAYRKLTDQEAKTRERLTAFEKEYPGVVSRENISEIVENLNKKAKKKSGHER